MIVTVLALFGAGLASFLAPCVLPIVPGLLGALTPPPDAATPERGTSGPGGAAVAPVPGRLAAAGTFTLAFATVFAVGGIAAGAAGRLATSGAVGRAAGAAVAAFGVALLSGRPRSRAAAATTTRARPVVLGAAFALAWTPCVGPLAGAALVAAGGTGSAWRGGVASAAYAAGLCLPLVAVAAGLTWSRRVHRVLRRTGAGLGRVGGAALVAAGVAMVAGRYTDLVAVLVR